MGDYSGGIINYWRERYGRYDNVSGERSGQRQREGERGVGYKGYVTCSAFRDDGFVFRGEQLALVFQFLGEELAALEEFKENYGYVYIIFDMKTNQNVTNGLDSWSISLLPTKIQQLILFTLQLY